MAQDNLSTYLNDHLAGSVAGIEILDKLCELLEGTDGTEVAKVREEVKADKDALEELIEELGYGESPLRKAGGWITEKAAELKLFLDDPKGGPLRNFEALEAISLGIEGKRSLWSALASAHGETLGTLDLDAMRLRAEDQRNRIEAIRREFAKKALQA